MAVIIIATTVHIAHYYSATSHKHNVPPSKHEHDLPNSRQTPPAGNRLSREDRAHFVHWVAVPCLGAALTTGFGFLMLAFNELQPARELGIELFVGSVLAFVGAYLAWMWFAPFPARKGTYLSADRLEAVEHAMVKRPLLMTSCLVLLLAGLGFAAAMVNIDADPFSFFRPESGPGKSLAHFTERKFGFYVLDVVCVPKNQEDHGNASAEKNRRAMSQFEDSLRGPAGNAENHFHRVLAKPSRGFGGETMGRFSAVNQRGCLASILESPRGNFERRKFLYEKPSVPEGLQKLAQRSRESRRLPRDLHGLQSGDGVSTSAKRCSPPSAHGRIRLLLHRHGRPAWRCCPSNSWAASREV